MLVIKYIIIDLFMALLWTAGFFFVRIYTYSFIRKDIREENRNIYGIKSKEKEEKERKYYLGLTKKVMISAYIIIFVVLMYTGFHHWE